MAEEMNCRERLHAALDQNPIDRVPCPGILQTGTVDLMDACGAAWPEAHTDPEKMAKLSWAAYEFAGLEGIRVGFTVYTEAVTLGAKLRKFKKDNQPMVEEYVVKELEDIDKIEIPDPKRDGWMAIVLKATELLVEKCEREKIPITVMALGPLPLALDDGVTDLMKGMIWLKTNKDDVMRLFKKMCEVNVTFSEAAVDAGADIILYNNGLAGTIGEDVYKSMFFEGDKECIKKIRETGARVVIHHCSDPTNIISTLADLGAHGISIPEMVEVSKMREIVGDRVALVGGVNQLFTLIKKGPEDVMEEAKKAIEDGIDVLCPGCGFGAKTPLENMRAMVEAAKKYGKYGRLIKK
ncbi:MAG: uroporphyrinogen decarboxylase family protein [Candidatus Syntropharchaeia archaeon]